jgi:predicted secreted protein with PEFG-CTERM motif
LIPVSAGSKEIQIAATFTPENPSGARSLVPPVYVATDKNNYNAGDVIKVSGCTSLSLDARDINDLFGKEVHIQVMNPQGNVIWQHFDTPLFDGSFLISFPPQHENAINGTYTAKATYASESASSSFVIPEFPVFVTVIFAIATSLIVAMGLRKAP